MEGGQNIPPKLSDCIQADFSQTSIPFCSTTNILQVRVFPSGPTTIKVETPPSPHSVQASVHDLFFSFFFHSNIQYNIIQCTYELCIHCLSQLFSSTIKACINNIFLQIPIRYTTIPTVPVTYLYLYFTCSVPERRYIISATYGYTYI